MSDPMTQLAQVRRRNLRRLAETHTATGLAQLLGYTSPSYISQMIGPNLVRPVTEKTCRALERELDLEPGSLDLDLDDYTTTRAQG